MDLLLLILLFTEVKDLKSIINYINSSFILQIPIVYRDGYRDAEHLHQRAKLDASFRRQHVQLVTQTEAMADGTCLGGHPQPTTHA
jgi:hypothetical protein